jgi:3,4-dihydroxy 2-butanone 4-phosphate synthase / GTP cyclohydrolase II
MEGEAMRLAEVGEAVAELRHGRPLILVRDETLADGYLLAAAERQTGESLAVLLDQGPGIVGLALTPERLDQLHLQPIPFDQSARPFVPASEREAGAAAAAGREHAAAALRALARFRPGEELPPLPEWVVPLRAAWGGVLACPTPVEAAVDLARLAGLGPVGLVCKLTRRGGAEPLADFAARHGLAVVGLTHLIAHRRQQANGHLVRLPESVRLPTRYGVFRAFVYEEPLTGLQHLALVQGEIADGRPVLTRVHSECLTGDVLGSLRCDCGAQLDLALQRITEHEHGVFIYLRQEGRGIGLYNKLRTYALQEQGLDTVEANERLGFPADLRDYGIAAHILRELGVREIRLLTNNPGKVRSLDGHGVRVVERLPLVVSPQAENRFYLRTKRDKLAHLLPSEEGEAKAAGRSEPRGGGPAAD